MGYSRAGFDIVGVDINPQPHYPFEFILADWQEPLQVLPGLWEREGRPYAIHASPPCQAYTLKNPTYGRKRTHWEDHPDLLEPTRLALDIISKPYIIENVPGSPIQAQIMLCGTMFGLGIQKHRLFEGNWPMPFMVPLGCNHEATYNPWTGNGRTAKKFREAQGTPWIPMAGGKSRKRNETGDLYNAIPPAYTEFLGKYLLEYLNKEN